MGLPHFFLFVAAVLGGDVLSGWSADGEKPSGMARDETFKFKPRHVRCVCPLRPFREICIYIQCLK